MTPGSLRGRELERVEFRRLWHALRGPEPAGGPGPLRPNQLRREDVVLPRRRPAAPSASARPDTRPPSTPPRARSQPAAARQTGQLAPPVPPIRAALSSRDGLRQAMLLREVLGPPVSLRNPPAWEPPPGPQPPARPRRAGTQPERTSHEQR